jgi:hypothetical protein
MTYNLENPLERANFQLRAQKLAQKGRGFIVLEEKKPLRSNNQNSYLHVILSYFASQYGCSKEEAKVRFYKLKCNPDIFWIDNPRHEGEKMIRSSATLDSKEMSLSIQRFRDWSSSEAAIYLPEANEEDMLQYAMQEVERYKQFL